MSTVVDGSSDRTAIWDQIQAVQEGNIAAFAAIYDRYAGAVHTYVRHRTGDAELAEDVTSETFLRALRRIELVSDQGKDPQAWLFTIARNIVTDVAKTRWARSAVMGVDIESLVAGDAGPEAEVIARCTSAEMADYLEQLSREHRQCLALRFFWGLSVNETAKTMHRTDGAARALQHRAIRRLTTVLRNNDVVNAIRID